MNIKMRKPSQIALAGFFCLVVASAAVVWVFSSLDDRPARRPAVAGDGRGGPRDDGAEAPGGTGGIEIDNSAIDDGGFEAASRFTGTIHDPRSLHDLREAIDARGPRGRSRSPPPSPGSWVIAARTRRRRPARPPCGSSSA